MKRERSGHDNRQSRLCFTKILELAAEFQRVTFGQLHVLTHFGVGLSHPAFHVASRRLTIKAARRCAESRKIGETVLTRSISASRPSGSSPESPTRTGNARITSEVPRSFSERRTTISKRRLPFYHRSDRLPAESAGDCLVYISRVKIVLREHVSFYPNFQHWSAAGCFIFDLTFALARARNLFEHLLHFRTEPLRGRHNHCRKSSPRCRREYPQAFR